MNTTTNYQNSDTYRQTVDGRSVYVKRHLSNGWLDTPEITRAKAGREVEVIRRLATLPKLNDRLGTIKIVEADLDNVRIVTEEVPGNLLQDVLFAAKRQTSQRNCLAGLWLAGKWLRVFQTLSTDTAIDVSSPANPDDLVDYCDLRLQTLMELGHRWLNKNAHCNVIAWLQRQVEATDEEQLAKVWCHGDYGSFNMIWDGYRLTPIDFATASLGLPLVDLTYLIHRIEMLPLQFPWRRWPVTLWRKACLRGYGLPDADRLPIYQALAMRHLLCRLHSLVNRPAKNRKQSLHNAWLRRCVTSKIRRMIETP